VVQLPIAAGLRALAVGGTPIEPVVWAGYRGGLARLTVVRHGGLRVDLRIGLTADAAPSAIAETASGLAVADPASDSVWVLAPRADGGFRVRQRLAVGADPVAIAVGEFDGQPGDEDLAVLNRGSADVSILGDRYSDGFAPEATVAVGGDPAAMAAVPDLETDGRTDLALADRRSDSVKLLRNNGHGWLTLREQVRVGADPVGVVAWHGLVTVNAGDGTVSLVRLGSKPPFLHAATTVPLPGASPGGPSALAVGNFNHDDATDLVALDPQRGRATTLLDDGQGVRPMRPIAVPGHPASVVALDAAEDAQDDLITADEQTGVVSIAATPGDRLLVGGARAANLVAGAGYLVWSRWWSRGRYALEEFHDGVARRLHVRGSVGVMRPRFGRDRRGDPVVTYGRCSAGACAAYSYDLRTDRETRLPVSVPRGCEVFSVARWHAALALWLRARNGGTCTRRGAWVSWTGRDRQWIAAAHLQALGDVRSGRVVWVELHYTHADRWWLRSRVLYRHGRARTVARTEFCDAECQGDFYASPPVFDGRWTYSVFSYAEDYANMTIVRTRGGRRASCRAGWTPGNLERLTLPAETRLPDVAFSRGHIYYATPRGVLEVQDPLRHWTRAGCR
jgi:hypothetical protein